MVNNINREGYIVNGYRFKDFTTLSFNEKKMVYNWRNNPKINKWMYNQNAIKLEDHLRFIDSLALNDDRYYWLVYIDDVPVGVFDVTNVDRNNNSAEPGLYMNPSPDFIGSGFSFVKECFYFFFGVLNIHRAIGGAVSSNKNILYLDEFFGFVFNKSERKIVDGEEIEYLYSDNLTREVFLDIYNGKSNESDFIKWFRIHRKKEI